MKTGNHNSNNKVGQKRNGRNDKKCGKCEKAQHKRDESALQRKLHAITVTKWDTGPEYVHQNGGMCKCSSLVLSTFKTVLVWSGEATSMLQDCFEHTEWEVFKEWENHLSWLMYNSARILFYQPKPSKHFQIRNHGWTAQCKICSKPETLPIGHVTCQLIARLGET